jgi:hypothetical protein
MPNMRQWLGQFMGLMPKRMASPSVCPHSCGVLRRVLDDRRARLLEVLDGGRHEHVLLIRGQVPRGDEQLLVEDLRRDDLVVARALVEVPHVLDEAVVDLRARAGGRTATPAPTVERDEVQLLAELAVVARLGLFELLEVRVERLGRRERGAVDALEHRVALVAAPVGPGHRGELEGLEEARADGTCGPSQRSTQSPWR